MKKIMTASIVLSLVAGSSFAALTVDYEVMGNMSSTVGALTNSLTVAAGDVVVMVAGSNKKASVNYMTFTSSAAGPVFDLSAEALLSNDPNPNAYLSYIEIGSGGTYDFISTTDVLAMTANVGLYHLSADSGLIEFAASNAKKYSGLAAGASLSVTNFMSWGGNLNAGDYGDIVTIGAASSLRGNISTATLSLDIDKVSKRLAGTSDRTGFNNEKHIWDITNPEATKTESGGITGAAFAEVIPEPATLGLLSVSGLLLWARRKFNKS